MTIRSLLLLSSGIWCVSTSIMETARHGMHFWLFLGWCVGFGCVAIAFKGASNASG